MNNVTNKIPSQISYEFDTPIIKDGKGFYSVIISRQASEAEKFAAEQLVGYYKKMTNVELSIYDDNSKDVVLGERLISVGKTALLEKSHFDFSNINFNNDGFIIKTLEKTLFLFGGSSKRGNIYAVYDYLEQCCGCKFLTPECEYIPQTEAIYLPLLNVTDIPAFAMREVVYDTLVDGEFSAKTRLNNFAGITDKNTKKFGEQNRDYIWCHCHNFTDYIIPYEKYKTTHPEWFYTSNNKVVSFIPTFGVTREGGYDFSLKDNPVDIATESIKNAILNSNAFYFHISQCDVDTLCSDPEYVERKKLYTDSGVLLLFINLVCEKLDKWIETAKDSCGNKLFPKGRDYQIMTFAYSYTQFPPVSDDGKLLISLNPRIYIWLAPIEFNCLYPYNHDMQIHYVTKLIANWTKLTKNVGIWDYYSNFLSTSMYYAPYISTACDNYKYYEKCGITGYVMSEFAGYNCGPRNAFDEIKTYCSSKLLWDPFRYNVMDLVSEFCKYYYEDYSKEALSVINAMEKQISFLCHCSRNYALCHSDLNWAQFFPLKLLQNNIKIIDKALAKNERSNASPECKKEMRKKLKKLKLQFVYNQMYEYDTYFPRSSKNSKKEFTIKFLNLLNETDWKDYYGKQTDYIYELELKRLNCKEEQ